MAARGLRGVRVCECTVVYSMYLTQGVMEYSLALFFNKLVSYTFLFWLPFYVKDSREFTVATLSLCFTCSFAASIDATMYMYTVRGLKLTH